MPSFSSSPRSLVCAVVLALALALAGCADAPSPQRLEEARAVKVVMEGRSKVEAFRIAPTVPDQGFLLAHDVRWGDRAGPCLSLHAQEATKELVLSDRSLVVAARPGDRWSVTPVASSSRLAESASFRARGLEPFLFHAAVDELPGAPGAEGFAELSSEETFRVARVEVPPPSCIREVSDLEGGRFVESPAGVDASGMSFDWRDGPGVAFVTFDANVDHDVRLAQPEGGAWRHEEGDGAGANVLWKLPRPTARLDVQALRGGPGTFLVAMFVPLPPEALDLLPAPPYEDLQVHAAGPAQAPARGAHALLDAATRPGG